MACSCGRRPVPPEAYPDGAPEEIIYIMDLDSACPSHGDGTEWWKRITDHATALAQLGLMDLSN